LLADRGTESLMDIYKPGDLIKVVIQELSFKKKDQSKDDDNNNKN
jgi:hypothetical protein